MNLAAGVVHSSHVPSDPSDPRAPSLNDQTLVLHPLAHGVWWGQAQQPYDWLDEVGTLVVGPVAGHMWDKRILNNAS